MPHTRTTTILRAGAVLGALGLTGGLAVSCSAPAAEDSKEINVLLVNNQTQTRLSEITADTFTAETGIKVNFTLLAENDLRDKVTQEVSSQAGQYDVVNIGSYEMPIFADNGWLAPLDEYVLDDEEYNQDGILPSMRQLTLGSDGKIYGEPLEGESSFLMYNKQIFADAGVTISENPTWSEVVEVAAQLKAANPDITPICVRGLPGWGQMGSSLTTVVNTFGGTWFDEDWNAQLTAPEFVEATEFYVSMLQNYGPAGAAQVGVFECFTTFGEGTVGMWYDTTNAPIYLETEGSAMKGNIGYVAAPVEKTDASGWLFHWGLSIEAASTNKDSAAAFIKWATSEEFDQLIADTYGWEAAPPGRRASLYENPDYLAAGAAFVPAVQYALDNADPADPGLQPRPTLGIQYVAIPEFAQLGDRVTEEIASAIAGQQTVEQALEKAQVLAEEVGEKYQG
ncbi:ABC transporter substrate-binding protein [Microbacterium sp. RD1]|uniref:ABC transporter substrate-binding protein n=1 Tax=Microbacterium sp. RD1 TaxID=3457313 RepID=UPI003FA5DF22